MVIRRLRALLALGAALILPACGSGSSEQNFVVPLSLTASGGAAPEGGTGGVGGGIEVAAQVAISLTTGAPAAPAVPFVPTISDGAGVRVGSVFIVGTFALSGLVQTAKLQSGPSGLVLPLGDFIVPSGSVLIWDVPASVTVQTGNVLIAGEIIGDAAIAGHEVGFVVSGIGWTCYMAGEIDFSLATTGGVPGGLRVSADRLVVTGSILTDSADPNASGQPIDLLDQNPGAIASHVYVGPFAFLNSSGALSTTGLGTSGGAITLAPLNATSNATVTLAGTVLTSGGDGLTGGGDAGTVVVTSGGNVEMAGEIVGSGGRATGTLAAAGLLGTGGGGASVFLGTTGPLSVSETATVSLNLTFFGAPTISAPGGAGTLAGSKGGQGGSVTMACSGSIAVEGTLRADGGTGDTGGPGGAVTVAIAGVTGTAVALPVGLLALDALVTAEGGAGGSGLSAGAGGRGGTIEIGNADGEVSVSGQIAADGGFTDATNNVAAGGVGGTVTVETDAGFLGAAPFNTPSDGKGGAVVNTASITVNGGASSGAAGGAAGTIRIDSDPASLGTNVGASNAAVISAQGGSAISPGFGGAGGSITISGSGPTHAGTNLGVLEVNGGTPGGAPGTTTVH